MKKHLQGLRLYAFLWFLLFTAFSVINIYGQGPACKFDWAKRVSGLQLDEGKSVSTDASGNVYVTGKFEDKITFGNVNLQAKGESDIFIAKYNAVGQPVWAKQMGGIKEDAGHSIVSDEYGNTYVTGIFSDRATFGTFTLLSRGLTDIFLIKLDGNGSVVFAKRAGSLQPDFGNGIALDKNNNIYLTGSISDTSNFTGTSLILPNKMNSDIFVAKYDSKGNVQWANCHGGAGDNEAGRSISVDTLGNVYITGTFTEIATFGTANNVVSNGGIDVFFAKFSPDGTHTWVKGAGSPLDDSGNGIVATPDGKSYSVGTFQDNFVVNGAPIPSNGGSDVFLIGYDKDGNLTLANSFGSASYDGGNAIVRDASGRLLITGYYSADIAFGLKNLISKGARDIFVSQIDESNGTPTWAFDAGGNLDEEGTGISVNSNGLAYITGYFNGVSSFGAIDLTSSSALSDIYVAKICNFVKKYCDLNIDVALKDETPLRNDGSITVKNVTGALSPYSYSLDGITFKLENKFENLPGGEYTLYVQSATGCTDSLVIDLKDVCDQTYSTVFVGLDSIYCATNTNRIPLKLKSEKPFTLLGFSGDGVDLNEFVPGNALLGQNLIKATIKFENTCIVDIEKIIRVEPYLPAKIFGLDSAYCNSGVREDVLTATPPGGTFSGPGVKGNIFKPINAGIGTHTITYSFNTDDCPYMATKTVVVTGASNIDIVGLDTIYCFRDPRFIPLILVPPGGTLIGKGIAGNDQIGYSFVPGIADKGVNRISYYGVSGDGCPFAFVKYVTIADSTTPKIAPYPATVCESAPNKIKFTATPPGGAYAGPGVSSNGEFDPIVAGVGDHTLYYTGKYSGCEYLLHFPIKVTPTPKANLLYLPERICTRDTLIQLRGVPSGGVFVGQGIASNTFNPAVAGPGQHIIIYSADSNNCKFIVEKTVEVVPTIARIRIAKNMFCVNESPVRLAATPLGGFFVGQGMDGNVFNPALSGPGTFLITYMGDSAGCDYEANVTLTVTPEVIPTISGLSEVYCLNGGSISTLTGFPSGGFFSGPGVTGNAFAPSLAGMTGEVVIEYSGILGACSYSVRDTVKIIDQIDTKFIDLKVEYCNTDFSEYIISATPPGGEFTVNGAFTDRFIPGELGVGIFDVTYSGDSAGCFFAGTSTIIVSYLPEVKIIDLPSTEFCSKDNTPIILKATPPGGTFTGEGVIDGIFYPKLIGDGFVDINYTGNFKGCDYFTNQSVVVVSQCCPIPVPDTVSKLTTTSARLHWYAILNPLSSTTYDLQYREEGSPDWITVTGRVSTNFDISGLLPCTRYEFRVRAYCVSKGYMGDYSTPKIFSTRAPFCLTPENLEAFNIQTTSAKIGWTAPLGCASNYELQYRKRGDRIWTSTIVSGTERTIIDLLPNTEYVVRVRTKCGPNQNSSFTANIIFKTPMVDIVGDCEKPLGFQIEELTETKVKIDWLPVGGYRNYEFYFRIVGEPWIKVVTQNSEFEIDRLQPGKKYEVRVRTNCMNGAQSEFTDTLNFVSLPVCETPVNFLIENLTSYMAVLVWDSVPNAMSYDIRYRKIDDLTWTITTTTETNFVLSDLIPEGNYEAQVKTNCNGNMSSFTPSAVISTPPLCVKPTNVNVIDVTTTTATLSWNLHPDVELYEICWQEDNTVAPCTTFFIGNQNSNTISELMPGVDYSVKIRSVCGNNKTDFVYIAFTTPEFKSDQAADFEGNIEIYPNPSKGEFTISLAGVNGENGLIEIFDVSGKRIYEKPFEANTEKYEILCEMENVASGLYMVKIGVIGKSKFIKLIID